MSIRYTDLMAHTNTTTASILDEAGDLVEVDLRTLSADRLEALRTDAGEAGDLDLVDSIDSLGPDRADLLIALGDLVERYRVAIIDGDLDADQIEAMDTDDGLVVDLDGLSVVLWLRDERDDRAVVAWLGDDLDPDQDHLVEAELDIEDGWQRLNSSTPSGVANELAQLAGDVEDEDWVEDIADELIYRGLLRRRGFAGEIVEIRRMTEASFDRVVAVAVGA